MKNQPRERLAKSGLLNIAAALLLANDPLFGQSIGSRASGVAVSQLTSDETVRTRAPERKTVRKPEVRPAPEKARPKAAMRTLAVEAKALPSPSSRPAVGARREVVLRTAVASPEVALPPPVATGPRAVNVVSQHPWKFGIVTTVFWAGEAASGVNTVSNTASSWDGEWARNYGGYDTPHTGQRRNFVPVAFTPRQNPFYVALPYNDVTSEGTKAEARKVIPWFNETFVKEGRSVCHNRWVAIRNRAGAVAYAQWSDCGPFRADHWQYVFGTERPKPNLNRGAGLDVSPATRDYLELSGMDVTDWRFVEAWEVPAGPWTAHGRNSPAGKAGTHAGAGSSLPRAEVAGRAMKRRMTALDFAFSRMIGN
jgi:hypothetical protein